MQFILQETKECSQVSALLRFYLKFFYNHKQQNFLNINQERKKNIWYFIHDITIHSSVC